MKRLKNFAIKAFISLSFKKKNVNTDPTKRRILVVSTTGLGDTIWGTPALRAIKKQYPESFVGVLTSPIGYHVLKNNPHVDRFFLLKKGVMADLEKMGFETVFIFHVSQRLALPIAYFTYASEIIGTEGINKGLDFILTHKMKNQGVHAIQRRLDLLKVIGIESSSTDLEIATSPKEIASFDFSRPLIGLHPGAKDPFKRWNAEHFVTLGNRLSEHGQIVLTGSPDEEALLRPISEKIPGSKVVCNHSVQGLAALIGRLSLFIANDTGPMHIGFAVKAPTIALFAPTDPKMCGPYNVPTATLIAKMRTCTPCLKQRCRQPFCMMQISPDEVYQQAVKMMKTKNPHGSNIGL